MGTLHHIQAQEPTSTIGRKSLVSTVAFISQCESHSVGGLPTHHQSSLQPKPWNIRACSHCGALTGLLPTHSMVCYQRYHVNINVCVCMLPKHAGAGFVWWSGCLCLFLASPQSRNILAVDLPTTLTVSDNCLIIAGAIKHSFGYKSVGFCPTAVVLGQSCKVLRDAESSPLLPTTVRNVFQVLEVINQFNKTEQLVSKANCIFCECTFYACSRHSHSLRTITFPVWNREKHCSPDT